MLNPRVANRYAKSLMDVAIEQNQMEALQEDMKFLQQVCKQSRDFTMVLKSPIIPADKKMHVLEQVTAGKIHPITGMFLKLLITKNREANLPEIAGAYQERYNQIKGIHRVKITTAIPVGENVIAELIKKLKQDKNIERVEVETAVDPKLIGGYKMQMEDFLMDNTISRDLNDVKKQFMNNDYLHRIR